MVPYDQVAAILGDARVGLDIHPWLGPHLKLAFAVKVAEYMASGCAVVASAMPVLEDLLAPTQFDPGDVRIVRGESPVQYASEVVALLRRIDAGENPGDALRRAAMKTLVWEEEAKKIATLYRTLLNRETGARSSRSSS